MPVRAVMKHPATLFIFYPEWLRGSDHLGYTYRIFVRFIASFFVNAGILEKGHPASLTAALTDPEVTLMGVVADAWLNVERGNLSQLAMFGVVVGFLAALTLGIVTAFLQAFVGSAWAADGWQELVQSNDIAGKWLQQTFGILGVNAPQQVSSALGAMLLIYNVTALGLGLFLTFYSAGVVVMESAKHGRVGGQRHSMLWAPIRLVFAIGLLAPVSDGWSGGQLLTVWLAGQGSKIASTSWAAFTNALANGQGAIVNPPMATQLEPVIGAALMIETCMDAFNTVAASAGDPPYIKVTLEKQIKSSVLDPADLKFFVDRNYDGTEYYPRKACGSIRFTPPENATSEGQKAFIQAHRDAFVQVLPQIQAVAHQIVLATADSPLIRGQTELPPTSTMKQIAAKYALAVTNASASAVAKQNGEAQRRLATQTQKAGWVAAPAWVHTISRLNGEIMEAASSPPRMTGPNMSMSWPDGVRYTLAAAEQYWNTASSDMGLPSFSSVSVGSNAGPLDALFSTIGFLTVSLFDFKGTDPLAEIISLGHSILAWCIGVLTVFLTAVGWANSTGFAAAAGGLFGGPTGAVASLSAQLAIGKPMAATLGFLAPLIAFVMVALFTSGGALAVGVAILPLVRWLFGCVSWLLGIFEAIVAVPIMLVMHIRSDGEGLAGPMAQSGYMILLSNFLRPVLMVFSLVVGILIFGNVVWLENLLFLPNMRATGASGNTMGFFIGVMYVVAYCATTYGLANASMKCIDLLPNQILRWVGGQIMHDLDGSAAVDRAISQGSQTGAGTFKEGMAGMGKDNGSGAGPEIRKGPEPQTQDILPKMPPQELY